MFKVLNNGWLNNINNYVIKISTEKENSLWQIFKFTIYLLPVITYKPILIYIIPKFFRYDFSHNFNTTVTSTDNILTLSIFYNNSNKMVVHTKLIKKEVK